MLFQAVHVFAHKCDGILLTEIHDAGADLRQSSFTKIEGEKKPVQDRSILIFSHQGLIGTELQNIKHFNSLLFFQYLDFVYLIIYIAFIFNDLQAKLWSRAADR